ncbi:hypothetical protein WJX73_000162 [Symbiochloris irregularis]|uniref:Exocyst complex component Sec8 n=1 Tax=Symbiochloris irregularis TaxID=706552 RepID=A0AAW1PNE7_9CHLO
MALLDGSADLNWDEIDEELSQIPTHFSDPRFDSLKHVLDVLSAFDSEPRIIELREYYGRVDELVDTVAETYSGGFRRSITNYSSILQFFTTAREEATGLHTNLEEARRRLAVHSQNLQSQSETDMKLGHVVRILTDIAALVEVPQHIQRLQDRQDWPGAVAALLDGCSKLAREELAGVGALNGIRQDLAARKVNLYKGLVHQLEELIFYVPPQAGSAGSDASAPQDPNRLQKLQQTGSVPSSRGLPPSGRPPGKGSALPPRPGAPRASSGDGAGPSGRGKEGESDGASAASPGDGDLSSVAKMTSAQRSEAASRLAACLVQSCGHMEALSTMRRHMPVHMKNVIVTSMQLFDPPKNLAASVAAAAAAATQGSHAHAVPPAVGNSAQKLADHVFINCLQVLKALIEVVKVLGGAKPPNMTPGLSLLLSLQPPLRPGAAGAGTSDRSSSLVGDPTAGGSPQLMRRECEHAWACMQSECQALLADLLAAPSLQARPDASGRRTDPMRVSSSDDPGILTFSFDVQVQGMEIERLLQRQRSVVAVDEGRHQLVVLAALGNHPCTAALTPYIHRPSLQFTEAAGRLVASTGGEGGLLEKGRALLLAPLDLALSPLGQDLGLAGGGKGATSTQLRAALERFITDRFLPDVYVHFRGQCTRLLEGSDSFKAPARARGGVYSPSTRPLVGVCKGVKGMVAELLHTAHQMPLFETNLIGMVENVLGRVLDAFSMRVNEALGNSACRTCADDPALSALMARERSAPQLGEPVAFFAGRNPEGVDNFVTGVIKAGFGTGGEDTTAAVLEKLTQSKWVVGEQLLSRTGGTMNRPVALASLADSCSYLADDIHAHIKSTKGPKSPGPGGSSSSEAASSPTADKQGGSRWRGSDSEHLFRGLNHLADQYKALAGMAIRALRLDAHLTLLYYLSRLPRGQWAPGTDNPSDVEDCLGALSRSYAQSEEDLGCALSPSKRSYVFGGLATAAATFCIWLLSDIREMDRAGAAKMQRHLTLLRDTLGRVSGQRPDEASSRAHERARLYYDLLRHSTDSLLASLESGQAKQLFSANEMAALLQVSVKEREVTPEHRARMARLVSGPGLGQAFQNQARAVLDTSLSLATGKGLQNNARRPT